MCIETCFTPKSLFVLSFKRGFKGKQKGRLNEDDTMNGIGFKSRTCVELGKDRCASWHADGVRHIVAMMNKYEVYEDFMARDLWVEENGNGECK